MSDQTGLPQTNEWLKSAMKGEVPAFAKLLTALEREGPVALSRYPELVKPPGQAFRIGITGPPGAGKSTLIGAFISKLRALNLKVGVIAVDPSSPFSKGAVLGDRIRYSHHFGDKGVFIRSLGSRGSLGGLSSAAWLMVRAFDIAGFDIVLIETVGVGQTELEIMNVADWVSVVLVPESGDSIQGMKAGLLEIASAFIVNKSDRPGADAFAHELEAALALGAAFNGAKEIPKILRTTATTGEGLDQLLQIVTSLKQSSDWRTKRQEPARLRAEAQALLRAEAERAIEAKARTVNSPDDFIALFKI